MRNNTVGRFCHKRLFIIHVVVSYIPMARVILYDRIELGESTSGRRSDMNEEGVGNMIEIYETRGVRTQIERSVNWFGMVGY